MQATAVAGTLARRWPFWSRSPRMPIAARGVRILVIDRSDRTVVSLDFLTEAGATPLRMELPRAVALDLTLAIARTTVMVVLAALAVLVLLPAALAAQAAAI